MSKKTKMIIGVAVSVLAILAAVVLILRFTGYWVGETVHFGQWDWRVLDVQNGKALLITENIIEQRPYDEDGAGHAWETCPLRAYLNGEFLENFTPEEQDRICDTENVNLGNHWLGGLGREGGGNTTDKVFLLSIEEVVDYFGDSGQLRNGKLTIDWFSVRVDDQYNSKRVAKFNNGEYEHYWNEYMWWLRSPGFMNAPSREGALNGVRCMFGEACVDEDGTVYLSGYPDGAEGGVRPALWIELVRPALWRKLA
ncbi:MAG: DUF6273 domain-containing protein [Oscillospiraceae bacterium]|jgi:hypothetical protein|nr:DUF6273 domain-containing protein [Oscillospiraceae bacterium]